jgi:hypothetical protein
MSASLERFGSLEVAEEIFMQADKLSDKKGQVDLELPSSFLNTQHLPGRNVAARHGLWLNIGAGAIICRALVRSSWRMQWNGRAYSLRTYLNNVLQHPGPFTDPDYDASQVADNMANMKLLSVAAILEETTFANAILTESCWLLPV